MKAKYPTKIYLTKTANTRKRFKQRKENYPMCGRTQTVETSPGL